MIASFAPPTDLAAHAGAEEFFTALMALVVLGALAWAIRKGEYILLVLIPAAAVSSFIEPFYDGVAHAWWATNLTTSFTLFDGRIYCPTMFPLGYAMWVGLGTYAAFRIFERRPGKRWLFKAFAVLALCEPALEAPWLATNLFEYHGDQPYRIFGYSLLWDSINTAGVTVLGATLLWLHDTGRLEGRGIWNVAALPFMAIGVYFTIGSPAWFAMQINDALDLVLWIAGTITLAIGATITTKTINWVVGWNSGLSAPATAEPMPGIRQPVEVPAS